MHNNVFTPKIAQKKSHTNDIASDPISSHDRVSRYLFGGAQAIVIAFAAMLPIFFIPGIWGGLGFQKAVFGLSAVSLVAVLLGFLVLRRRSAKTLVPFSLLLFTLFFTISAISAAVSTNPLAGFRGSLLETGTVGFLFLMGCVMAAMLVLQKAKAGAVWLQTALFTSAAIVLLYSAIRIVVGPVMSFGTFSSITISPVGGLNDLAVFAGLSVVVGIILLARPQLPMVCKVLIPLLILTALSILAVVNFYFIWLVLAFFGLVVLLYVVSQDIIFSDSVNQTFAQSRTLQPVQIGMTALVCLVGAFFIIFDQYAADQVSRLVNVQYIEARPSLGLTIDMAQAVYRDNGLLGVGPNQFVDAWRMYKNDAINESIFWDTDFVAGSSFVTTTAVTSGLLGLLSLIVFHIWYAWFGIRLLLLSRETTSSWYHLGLLSFSAAAFLWLMSYVYVPGATILLFAAVFTGVSFAAAATIMPKSVRTIPLVINRQRGFALMTAVILVISASVGVLYSLGQQYYAHASFNKAQANVSELATLDQQAAIAYTYYQDPLFLGVRGRIALIELSNLLTVDTLTEDQQQQFIAIAERGQQLMSQAAAGDPNNPDYPAMLSALYHSWVLAGVPDALARSTSSMAVAQALDPKNPTYDLAIAQMSAAQGNLRAARQSINAALAKKTNFTPALLLLAEIDIAEGDTDAAIAATRAIISLEPNNATRYYQLGILHTANENIPLAIEAYTQALNIDTQYANARYLRALLYLQTGDVELAIGELQLVQETNQESQQLADLINQLQTQEVIPDDIASDASVEIEDPGPTVESDVVTSPIAPDSDLITSPNVPATIDSQVDVIETNEIEVSETADADEVQDTSE